MTVDQLCAERRRLQDELAVWQQTITDLYDAQLAALDAQIAAAEAQKALLDTPPDPCVEIDLVMPG